MAFDEQHGPDCMHPACVRARERAHRDAVKRAHVEYDDERSSDGVLGAWALWYVGAWQWRADERGHEYLAREYLALPSAVRAEDPRGRPVRRGPVVPDSPASRVQLRQFSADEQRLALATIRRMAAARGRTADVEHMLTAEAWIALHTPPRSQHALKRPEPSSREEEIVVMAERAFGRAEKKVKRDDEFGHELCRLSSVCDERSRGA